MLRITYRARWARLAAFAFGVGAIVGCDWKNALLDPQNSGIVDASAVNSAPAALALKAGAIGRVKLIANCGGGECLWQESGHLADEYKNSDFQPDRQSIDQRQITSSNGILGYNNVTTSRGYLRTAIAKLVQYSPTSTADIAELWMTLAYVETIMSETYCNGIPLGVSVGGVVDYSDPSFKPLTNQEVYTVALSHVDSALTILGAAVDVASTDVRRASLILKARILVNQGQWAAAAALVPTGTIASTYQYMWTTQAASNADDNGNWNVNNNVARLTVGDSFDFGVAGSRIFNAIPFATLNDTRIPVIKATTAPAEDGTTPLFIQQIWKNRDDPQPLFSGIDARLIEAEAQLHGGTIAGMMTILNALRATPPKIGNYQPAALGALVAPGTQALAEDLFFREKALWTFGRGIRLGDLRRMIRQYSRIEANVFPRGNYFKGGTYGTDVNFPVPDLELPNPQFKGCIDRSA